MQLTEMRIDKLVEAPFNYNRHPETQLDQLIKSLDQFDQFKNIVVWKGQVIAGNGLVKAARKAKKESLHVLVRDDLTEDQARSLCAADNALPALSEPDPDALKKLFEGIDEPLEIPGVTDDWIEKMCGTASVDDIDDEEGEEVDEDEIWDGMPEFENDDDKPFHTIQLHFNNQHDLENFGALISQKSSHKPRFLWHPKQVKENLKQFRCQDES